MYSVVLMAALTAGGQMPDGHGCHASYGSCYGSCYGNYGIEGYCGCHGGCWGNSYTCTGGCYGSCWGAGYGSGCCGCFGSGEASPYFPSPPAYAPPAYAPPTMAPAEPPVKGEAVPAPKKTSPESLAPTNARLIVEVPADAKLYIDDHAMQTPSERRTYLTPELQPGQTYFYEVRVEVERDGKTLSTTKRVLLKAGEEARADFKDMDTTATAKAQ